MLILSRGIGECVLIGADVEVLPVELRDGDGWLSQAHVRLGFRAPRDVTILRSEVALRAARAGGGTGGPHVARKKLPGYTVEIPDAIARLRFALPSGRLVHHHKRSPLHATTGHAVESFRSPDVTDLVCESDPDAGSVRVAAGVVEIECRKDDSILVGNVTLVVVDVRRFVKIATPAAATR
jgi:carbon storage regulator CsrA